MLIKVNSPIKEGETVFRRKRANDRIRVHEGGNLHLERMYASGGMVVSVFHNYLTNKEEVKYDSIEHALEKYYAMREMRENSPEWVDEGLMPAILKAVRAAQRQTDEDRNISVDMGDPTPDDIEEECTQIESIILEARRNDPELDREMTRAEIEFAKSKNKSKETKTY